MLWSVALPVLGFTLPVYSSVMSTSSGREVHSTSTMVAENGRGVVVVLLVPLVASLLVAGALLVSDVPGARPFAWTLAAALCGFAVLGMFSIGLFVLPVAVALVAACAVTGRHGGSQPSP